MNKEKFERIKYALSSKAKEKAEKIHPIMILLGHNWMNFDYDYRVPTRDEIEAMFLTLLDKLQYHEGSQVYSASTGGLEVEIIDWPSSTSGSLFYSREHVHHTFPD